MKPQTTRVLPYLLTMLIVLLTLTTTARRAGVKALSCTANPVVTTNADSGGGSLRDAIANACDGSTITFANTVLSPITLSAELVIDKNLTIQGPGANALTISGNNAVRVFLVDSGNVTISGLTITNGSADSGAGIINFSSSVLTIVNTRVTSNNAFAGGGIYNSGIVAVINSTISGNSSGSNGIFIGAGGGIYNNNGAITLLNTTVSGNSANGTANVVGAGGGIYNSGPMTVLGSTVSGNSVSGIASVGGGIYNGGPTSVINSTISGNSSSGQSNMAGGIYNGAMLVVTNCTLGGNTAGQASGIANADTLNLRNTIIASGGAGVDCLNLHILATNVNNLIEDGSCSPALSGNPKLGPLQNNGGPTLTQALLAGSPAMDAGDDSVLGNPLNLTTDQRGPGFPRKSGLHVDIGAFEFQVPFDTCLRDNTTGNLLQWNSTSGAYKFTRCSDGFMLTGTGAVKLVNGIKTLTDFKTDRRISAAFNTGQLTGNATLYLMVAQGVWQSFQIVDTNPHAVCACPG